MGTQTQLRTSTDVRRNYNGSGRKKGVNERIYILKPEDFDVFPNTANRLGGLNRTHILKLKNSMKEYGFLQSQAIIVNEDLQIVDGHMRFTAAKELGIPIFYRVVENANLLDYAKVSSVVKKWSSLDWAEYHANNGVDDFVKLKGLLTEHNVKLSVAIPLVEDSLTNTRRNSKISLLSKMMNADLNVNSWGVAFTRAKLLNQIRELAPKVSHHMAFQLAWISISRNIKYDHKHMIMKLGKYASLISEQPTSGLYIVALLDVYNYRTRKTAKIQPIEIE